MDPQPVIRAGRVPDDVERCAGIWVRALATRDGAVDAETMAERVRVAFGNPIVRFAVATAPRAGFALLESGRPDPAEAYLHYLAVDPDGTGRGVGGVLMADAIAHARAAGFGSLTLEVRSDNVRAIELYLRTGFVPDGEATPHPTAGYPMQPYRLALG